MKKDKIFEEILNSDAIEAIEETETKTEKKSKNGKKSGKIKAFFKSRKAKHGSIAVAITAIAMVLVILVNVATGLLTARFPDMQIDLTAAGTYRLQEDTVEYLNQLDSDITVYILSNKKTFLSGLNAYGGTNYFVQAERLLTKADAASDKLTIKYIDLSDNPTFSSQYPDIDWSSTTDAYLMLVVSGDNYTALTLEDCFTYDEQYYSYGYYYWTGSQIEQALVTGMLDVTTGEKVKVEFLIGSGQDENIYGDLKSLLKKNAYEVSDVNLTTGELSEDTKIAVMYGPTVDLSEEAADKLTKWLNNDGDYGRSLIYLPIDQELETPNIDTLISEYGMEIENGLAFTTSSNYAMNSPYMFLTDYSDDGTYTETLKNATIPAVTYNAKAITITDDSVASPLLSITESAGIMPYDFDTQQIETEADLQQFMQPDGVNIAAIGKKTNSDEVSSNVVIFGSYSMLYQEFLSYTTYNNANYVVNLCNTLVNRGDMGITITSAASENQSLGIVDSSTVIAMGIIFIGVIPLVILLIGLFMFIRRRNR